MVVIVAPQAVDVQSHPGALRKALQAVRNHLGAQLPQPLALQPQVNHAVGTVGQVDDGAGKGLVQRRICVSEPGDAGQTPECLVEGVSESNAAIFSGVVVVNYPQSRVSFLCTVRNFGGEGEQRTVKIALAVDCETPARVLG